MQPLPGHTAWRAEQGLDFNLPLTCPGRYPYAANSLHDPRVSIFVLVGGKSGLDSQEHAGNECTAPPLADLPISDTG